MQQYALGTAAQISKRVESFLSQHTYNVKLIKSFFENQLIKGVETIQSPTK